MVLDITEMSTFFFYSTQASYSQVPFFFFFFHTVKFFSISLSHVKALFLSFFLFYFFFFFFFLISCRNSLLQVKENSKHLWPKKRSMNLVCILGVVPSHLFWQFVKNIKCKLLHFFTHETSWILCIFLTWACKPFNGL